MKTLPFIYSQNHEAPKKGFRNCRGFCKWERQWLWGCSSKDRPVLLNLCVFPQLESPHIHTPLQSSFSPYPLLTQRSNALSFTALLQAKQWLVMLHSWLIGYGPPGEHFGLFFFKKQQQTILNSVLIIPLSLHSCTGRTGRWIPESRIAGSEYILFRFLLNLYCQMALRKVCARLYSQQ